MFYLCRCTMHRGCNYILLKRAGDCYIMRMVSILQRCSIFRVPLLTIKVTCSIITCLKWVSNHGQLTHTSDLIGMNLDIRWQNLKFDVKMPLEETLSTPSFAGRERDLQYRHLISAQNAWAARA